MTEMIVCFADPCFALTSFVTIADEGEWVRIRVENDQGDFAQVRYRKDV